MILPYLWVGLTLVLLVISKNPSQGQAIISEEDLIRYYFILFYGMGCVVIYCHNLGQPKTK